MEINTIKLCFLLWMVVDVSSVITTVIHKRRISALFCTKELYVDRILYLMRKGTPYNKLLKELYMIVTSEKKLRKVVYKGVAKVNPALGFKYITKKLYCRPIKLINDFIVDCLRMGKESTNDSSIDFFESQFNRWVSGRKEIEKLLNRNRLVYIIDKTIIMIVNLALYYWNHLEITLFIFIVVNTIGVILFIVLDYECVVVDEKFHERKLAKKNGQNNKTIKPAIRVKELFQLVASLGLIINIVTVAAGFLEGAI